METFGARLRQLRKELHMTQVEFGRQLGLGDTSISKVEADSSKLTEAAIRLICATYKVNYNWLTEGESPMFQELSMDDLVDKYMAGESPLAISITKAFAHLPLEEWVKLRDLIDRIKKEGLP